MDDKTRLKTASNETRMKSIAVFVNFLKIFEILIMFFVEINLIVLKNNLRYQLWINANYMFSVSFGTNYQTILQTYTGAKI